MRIQEIRTLAGSIRYIICISRSMYANGQASLRREHVLKHAIYVQTCSNTCFATSDVWVRFGSCARSVYVHSSVAGMLGIVPSVDRCNVYCLCAATPHSVYIVLDYAMLNVI